MEVVDTAGIEKEEESEFEHLAQMFELMFGDALTDVQPQTKYEWTVSRSFANGQEQPAFNPGCLFNADRVQTQSGDPWGPPQRQHQRHRQQLTSP